MTKTVKALKNPHKTKKTDSQGFSGPLTERKRSARDVP